MTAGKMELQSILSEISTNIIKLNSALKDLDEEYETDENRRLKSIKCKSNKLNQEILNFLLKYKNKGE